MQQLQVNLTVQIPEDYILIPIVDTKNCKIKGGRFYWLPSFSFYSSTLYHSIFIPIISAISFTSLYLMVPRVNLFEIF